MPHHRQMNDGDAKHRGEIAQLVLTSIYYRPAIHCLALRQVGLVHIGHWNSSCCEHLSPESRCAFTMSAKPLTNVGWSFGVATLRTFSKPIWKQMKSKNTGNAIWGHFRKMKHNRRGLVCSCSGHTLRPGRRVPVCWLLRRRIPSAPLGNLLDENVLWIAVALSMGARICIPHTRRCGGWVNESGRHGLSCRTFILKWPITKITCQVRVV